MKVSEQLISQHISYKTVEDMLEYFSRWRYEWRRYDLRIELWAVGIWTNLAGLISYNDLAEWIRETTQLKASILEVRKLSTRLYLVQGRVKPWYAVHDGKCECMLYRQRSQRLPAELPQLYRAMGSKPYCHHTVAAAMTGER